MIEAKSVQQLDFNLLKVFECLYQERNMSLAAKLLFISPSAVSHAIKRLRVALNDELFTRQGQVMQPTPACQRMAPQLLDTLEKLRQILQACGDFDLSQTGQTFKIGIHDALESLVLPKLQQVLMKEAPNAKLTSSKLVREDMARQLATNQIDIAIDIALPLKTPIKHLKLSSDEFCVLLNKHHHNASNITPEVYLLAKHIAVSNRASGVVLEDFALLQQGINRSINTRCQSYQAARELVKVSDYLLTLPSLIAHKLADDDLVIRPIPYTIPSVSTHLYWHQNTEHDDALMWLREKVQHEFNA
ncbi:LysR family transcriptional regulator [Colwellia sp. Arc7-635]|uniref:LysR family transcriptional regulator n=1 Tax=Colwellia sp. Arc7-635 TaxID=2497879 RepID=UPI000F858F8E|nr:LysR family transcriptional regulator [Colwellia sp. Arc7-635]AZQ85943.1 LysR family transcriptional regulator [Colwellia sp. Arc7-635]